MSRHHIPYPRDFDEDPTAAHHEERRRRAVRQLDPGDVIATIEDLVAQIADSQQHPLYHLVLFYLDRQTAVHGGAFFDGWKALVLTAIDRCVIEALRQED